MTVTVLWHPRKKRQTSAKHSTHDTGSNDVYVFPSTYEDFCKQLVTACRDGDEDSKQAISDLAPHMATALKEAKEWDDPSLALPEISLKTK